MALLQRCGRVLGRLLAAGRPQTLHSSAAGAFVESRAAADSLAAAERASALRIILSELSRLSVTPSAAAAFSPHHALCTVSVGDAALRLLFVPAAASASPSVPRAFVVLPFQADSVKRKRKKAMNRRVGMRRLARPLTRRRHKQRKLRKRERNRN